MKKLKVFRVSTIHCSVNLFYESKSKKELIQCLILYYNICIELQGSLDNESDLKKAKKLKDTIFIIDGIEKEDWIENVLGRSINKKLITSCEDYFDEIREDYGLEGISNEELVKLSFNNMPPLRTCEEWEEIYNQCN